VSGGSAPRGLGIRYARGWVEEPGDAGRGAVWKGAGGAVWTTDRHVRHMGSTRGHARVWVRGRSFAHAFAACAGLATSGGGLAERTTPRAARSATHTPQIEH
jgi:hypothetical protein